MYIATNRFKIAKGREAEFEAIWKNRDSYVKDSPGFRSFNLLRGETGEDGTLYISKSEWESEQNFRNWMDSDSFKKAHASARPPEGMHLARPQFEGFTVVL